jgi:Lrp/AsnC family transcriptional regulator, leucine-responsive regulatory protein
MDRIDLAILLALEADGRLSFADLGEQVGLSKSPCWKRVHALEQAGVIQGYKAIVDPLAIGLETTAFIQVVVAFDQHDAFEAAVLRHPRILSAHATVGEADYLLHVIAPGMPALDEFLRQELWRLPGVQRFVTTMAMRTIKPLGSVTANLAPAKG